MLRKLEYLKANTYDLARFAAIVLMVVDHFGAFFFPEISWLRVVGRLAMPIFLFLVGYSQSTKIKPNLLLWAGAVALVQYYATGDLFPLNILFTIIIAKLVLKYSPTAKNADLLVLTGALCVFFPIDISLIQFGSIGVLFALAGKLFRAEGETNRAKISLCFAFVCYFAYCSIQKFVTGYEHMAFLVLGFALLGVLFTRFELKNLDLPTPITFISRYSLEFYAIHYIAFLIIKG